VAVKIKLKRLGKVHAPQYRIVIADSRTARNGRAIEEIGVYQPMEDPSVIRVDSDRVQYWLGVGAQPTEAVQAILTVTGDWQRFKGLPGAEGTLRVAEPKPSKTIAFEAAVKAAADAPAKPAAPKQPKAVATEAAPADSAPVDEAAADTEAEVAAAVEAEVAQEAAEAAEAAAEEAIDGVVADEAAADALAELASQEAATDTEAQA
jgi:small subunit ribosomal protein S16